MNVKITLPELTIESLKKNKFQNILPEIYALKECIENFPPWHFQENVYDHTLSVLKALENIFFRNNLLLQNYLNKKPANHYTIKELLWIATLFHDSGKLETLIEKDGNTSCPNHEIISAEKTEKILNRFDLHATEKKRIVDLVGVHDSFCMIKHPQPENDYQQYRTQIPEIFLDLLLFELADTQALHVAKEGKELQQNMIDFYEQEIKNYFSS